MPALHRVASALLPCGWLLAAACGGGSGSGEPLLSGEVAGRYESSPFTAINGFAREGDPTSIVAVGDGPIHCGTPETSSPPRGNNALIGLPSLEVGSYTDVFVQLYRNEGSFEGRGSGGGTAEITTSSADVVAGTVSYMDTDSDSGETYALDGTFEVIRCPEPLP